MITRFTRLALFTLLGLITFTASAHAAGITLSRSPAPPEVVKNDGVSSVRYNYTVTWEPSLTPSRQQIRIWRGQPGAPGSTIVQNNPSTTMAGAISPYISNPGTYTPPAGATPGAYYVEVIFYTNQSCGGICPANPDPDLDFEARASVQFGVSAATGNIRVRKFEDLNGNGLRESNEPGVAAWPFQIIAPNANLVGTTTYSRSTLGDGTFALTAVPAGPGATYQISEILPSPNAENWAPTTSTERRLTLSDGNDLLVEFGNARQTSLCGTTWHDLNGNGQHDADETPFPNVTVALGGRDGLGTPVSGTRATDARGRYCFGPLMPGRYSVTMQVPDNYRATWDKDGSHNGFTVINPIDLTSGQPSDGNDFGLYRPADIPPPMPRDPEPRQPEPRQPTPKKPQPRTKLCITKTVNKGKVRQGGAVTWTVTVKNCGRHVARDVAIVDPFIANTTLLKHKKAAFVRGSLVWNVGTLKVKAARKITFTVRFDRDARVGKHRNRARAEAANASTVSATATTKVVKKPRPPKKVAVTG